MTESITNLSAADRESMLDAVQDRLADGARRADIGPRPADRPAPASFAQRRHWFSDRLRPGDPAYNVPLALRLEGRLDIAALEAALVAVCTRHEVLRSTFRELDGEPFLHVGPPPADLLRVVERPPSSGVAGWLRAAAFTPFDLSTGPLLRAELLTESPMSHVLLLVAHHSVIDGWSLGLLLAELDAHYTAATGGDVPAVPALPVQYADFAAWQRDRTAENVGADLDYWRVRLAGAPPVLTLPTDPPDGAGVDGRHDGNREDDGREVDGKGAQGGWVRRRLPDALVGRLRELAAGVDGTMFVVLQAAFGTVLGRWAGTDDVVIGAPVASRPRPEVKHLIGDFLNTLPLRVRSEPDDDFDTLLRRVRADTVDGLAHQGLPFEQLVEDLRPERSRTVSPIFQVLLNHSDTIAAPRTLGDVTATPVVIGQPPSKFPLTLYADEQDAGLTLDAVFRTELYYPDRMSELLRQVEQLLDRASADPHRPLAEIGLAAPNDPVLPDPAVPLPAPEQPSLATLFACRVATAPEAPAVEFGDLALSYAQLAARVEAVAAAVEMLPGRAASPVVAVSGAHSAGTVAAALAVLTSGGVLLTLDPRLPRLRRQAMLTAAGAARLVRVGDAEQVGGDGLDVLRVGDDGSCLATEPGAQPSDVEVPAPVDDPAAAYVFFTSGSTGTPKAVVGRASGLSHFLLWQRDEFGIGPGDRAGQLTGLSFDVVLRDMLTPLISGATLVVPAHDRDVLPPNLPRWLAEQAVTVVHAVPSLLETWLADGFGDGAAPRLRLTFSAGEALTGHLATRWRAATGDGQVVNLYGPTETTLAKLAHRVPARPSPGVQPIGGPVPGAQALILNVAGTGAAVGEVGQIVLRTPFRSLGYAAGPPSQGPTVWTVNPATGDPDDVLYATGDLGRFRLDGSLDILGRADRQVKIRGVRVEPDEVAAVLGRHPAVQQAAVTAVPDQHGVPTLAAYLVAPGHTSGTASQVRGYLGKRLPPAAVPSSFLFVEQIPRTANGKTDWAALPTPTTGAEQVAYLAPGSPLERTVADVVAALLHRDRVGLHDGFFALGGHSLLAMQLVSRLADATGVVLPLQQVFETPTVAGLARALRDLGAADGTVDEVTG